MLLGVVESLSRGENEEVSTELLIHVSVFINEGNVDLKGYVFFFI